jgi:hypothetical protein
MPFIINTRTSRWLRGLLLVTLMSACGKEKISLENFDEQKWKGDRKGCKDSRMELSGVILAQKEKLLAHDEIDIITVLGKPDENELYKRNEKYYYYYVRPSNECVDASGDPKRLIIRFNAMGLAKEIRID